ncbi:Fur-regulated basic protein FbpA [Ectobacillus funiculus]|uniref:Fur-regulated basic protein FbpA n=1 Tax=Ectobacillus funiculus TaxID=137993 RepID=A0ABV5WKH3_9BACI
MGNLLRHAVEKKKQYLIDQLISLGFYQKDSHYLFEWTLSDLEKEYRLLKIRIKHPSS